MTDLLRGAVASVVTAGAIYLLAYAGYYTVLALAGIAPPRRRPWPEPRTRFVVLIPAHDEEATVTGAIRSLQTLDYPRELYEMVVLADNCNDGTGAVARGAGVRVLERTDPANPGKGPALGWAFEQLLGDEAAADAFCITDADNRAGAQLLRAFDARVQEGAAAVQAYLDTKDRDASWIAAVSALAYWSANRLFQLPRSRLGLGAIAGGTGFCIARRTLLEHGWAVTALTEDLEYQARLALAGVRTAYAPDARVYDEKPAGIGASMRQRLRWMQGYWDVAVRYVPALLLEGIRRGSVRRLEMAAYLLAPPRSLIALGLFACAGLSLMLPGWAWWFELPAAGWAAAAGAFALVPVLALPLEGAPPRAYAAVLYAPFFALTWAPLSVLGLLRRRRRDWTRTPHAPDSGG